MQVKQVMSENVVVVNPEATVEEAAKKMDESDVGVLPVCDNEELLGMVTDRDMAIRAVARGRDPKRTKVKDVMTPVVVYCYDDQDIEEAVSLMEERQLRRLVVFNRDKQLVGVLSIGDLALYAGNELAGEVLSEEHHDRNLM